VGEVNGRVFLNNSSLGLYPRIVRQRELQERHGHSRWLAFLWALVVVFKRFPFLHVRLSADGRELDRRTPFVFVGNNEYEMDSFNVGARACLDRGLLSLHVTHKAGRWRLIALALRALFGRLRAAKDFDSLCAREVWVETRRARLSVATDGEITVLHTPLHYRVRPGALRVIVPKDVNRKS
jgi:diacylglycerol kinase family enzyme